MQNNAEFQALVARMKESLELTTLSALYFRKGLPVVPASEKELNPEQCYYLTLNRLSLELIVLLQKDKRPCNPDRSNFEVVDSAIQRNYQSY